MIGPPNDDEGRQGDPWSGESEASPAEQRGPRVDIPQAPDPTRTDSSPDPEVATVFWKLVVTFNVALFTLALGPLLVYFTGYSTRGAIIFLLGTITFGYGIYRYRRFRHGELDSGESVG